jgi:teichuronic acid biosynthesis glycosyltransferase TuaC
MGESVRDGREEKRMTASGAPRTMSLHVLTITPFYPRSGDESGGCFVAEPLVALAKQGVQSTVFAVNPFYRPAAAPLQSSVKAHGFRYPALPGGSGLASAGFGLFLRLLVSAKRFHEQNQIDIIHAHGALPCGHAAELLSRHLKVPYVVTVHGLDAFSTRQVAGWSGILCERVSRRVYVAAAQVVGVSRRVCEEVQKGTAGQAKTSTVYNGVDPELFAPGSESAQPTVLTVGNLIPTKGHELMVRALADLRNEFPSIRWEVIGDGPELNRIRQLAEKSGVLTHIIFRGRQNRRLVAEAFQRCTVFVLPSFYEGLGCVYLEAMASGKVAIGCLGQGIDEVIEHGKNGWLVNPNSAEELTGGLRLLLRDTSLRQQIGAAARQTVLNSYTLDGQARRLIAVYRESIA